MPKLDDPMHLDMYRYSEHRPSRLQRLIERARRAVTGQAGPSRIYGYEWGDPDACPPLARVRDHFILPYVDERHAALEIGPGGGRWTQYLLGFGTLYAVDYHAEILAELGRNFRRPNLRFVTNSGTDFPGVPDASIDYLFSFGVFVHLDADLIAGYLDHMRRILRPGGNAILQYADKTKIMGRENTGFSENDPERMRAMVLARGFRIVEEDLTTLWHSSVVRFTR